MIIVKNSPAGQDLQTATAHREQRRSPRKKKFSHSSFVPLI